MGIPGEAKWLLERRMKSGNEQTEEGFVRFARAMIDRNGRNGLFLTHGPLYFLAREMGGKGQAVLMPGQRYQGDWKQGLSKTSVEGEVRPVIVPNEDYPEIPRGELADFFGEQARRLWRNERGKMLSGPDISNLNFDLPMTHPNSIEQEGVIDTVKETEQMAHRAMHRLAYLDALDKILGGVSDFVGFTPKNGRRLNRGQKVGLMLNTTQVLMVALDCRPFVNEQCVAMAQEVEAEMQVRGYSTLLCTASKSRMLLYLSIQEGTFSVAQAYGDLSNSGFDKVGSPYQSKGPISYQTLRHTDSNSQGRIEIPIESFDGSSTFPQILVPGSLYYLPPPPKRPTTKAFEGSNLITHETASGMAIVPIFEDDDLFEYVSHPAVAHYNFGKNFRRILNFLESSKLFVRPPSDQAMTVIDKGAEDKLKKWMKTKSSTKKIQDEEMQSIEPSITYALPYGRDVAIRVKDREATMVGFRDNQARTKIPQTDEIELMNEADEATYFGVLTALPGYPSDLPEQILKLESTSWQGVEFVIENVSIDADHFSIMPFKTISSMVGNYIRPAKHARNSMWEVHSDEIESGKSDKLGVFITSEGKTELAYIEKTKKALAVVIGMKATGKRYEQGESGPLILAVLSNEEVPIRELDHYAFNLDTRTKPQKSKDWKAKPSKRRQSDTPRLPSFQRTTVYTVVAETGNFVGIDVAGRRRVMDRVLEAAYEVSNDRILVDPRKLNMVVEVSYEDIRPADTKRYALESVLTTSPRYRTDLEEQVKSTYDMEAPPSAREDPKLDRLKYGRMPAIIATGDGVLTAIPQREGPLLINARITQILTDGEPFGSSEEISAQPEFATSEGKVFRTKITAQQFKRNPGVFITSVETQMDPVALDLRINPFVDSAHRQELPWKFDQGVFDGTSFRTLQLDKKRERNMTYGMLNRNRRYEDYNLTGVKAIVGKIDGKWAIQSYRVPKQYRKRRLKKEIQLDDPTVHPPPKWYLKKHPKSKAYGMKNPPVTPIPQKITGSKGFYSGPNGSDVTGRHYKNAKISSEPRQISVEWGNEVPEPEPKSSGMRIRFNMVRPSLWEPNSRGSGWQIEAYNAPAWRASEPWLITAETSKKHYYFIGSVNVETALTLARLEKKSEPRLRPETFGEITLGREVATIRMKSSGKEHPVYDTGWITAKGDEPKNNPLVAINEADEGIIAISGPPGSGKSSLQKEIKKQLGKKAKIVVSYTTRKKRTKEINGVDYHFVSKAKFEKMIADGEFTTPNGTDLYFKNYGNYYGRKYEDMKPPKVAIVDLSFEALEKYREGFEDIYAIFIKPSEKDIPREDWERILWSRGAINKREVNARIRSGIEMLKNWRGMDFNLVIANRRGEIRQTANYVIQRFTDSKAIENPMFPGEAVKHYPWLKHSFLIELGGE